MSNSDHERESGVAPAPPNLKRQRGTAKAAITRLTAQVGAAMERGQSNEVRLKLEALDEAVTRFREAHKEFHKTLTDEDDLDASCGYLTSVLRDAQDLRHTVVVWLEDTSLDIGDPHQGPEEAVEPPAPTPDGQTPLNADNPLTPPARQQSTTARYSTPVSDNPPPLLRPSLSPVSESSICQLLELSRQQYQLHVDSMRLPPTDIIKFDGEPLKYWQFIRLFSTVVDKETVPDEEKLTRLHQYTVGQAREAISHCLYNPDPSVGYSEAMATLKRRFGNSYTISQAWIDRVLSYGVIRDNRQLLSFADTLRSCADTLKAMGCEEELNGGRALLKIVEKLPDDLKKRWLNENYNITESGRLPKLNDVVRLVEREAAKRADPVFGNLLNRNSPASVAPNNKIKKKQTFAAVSTTKTKSPSPAKPKTSSFKCPRCSEMHFLNQCAAFRGLSVHERLEFVQQQKLCLNCFMKGHISSDCTRTWVCRVPGCGLKHNSWVHSAIVANNDNQQTTTKQQATMEEPTTNQPSAVQALATKQYLDPKRSKIALPILPVVVSDPDGRYSMNVFALLDNGSNGTFCSKMLIRALRLKSRPMNITLSTMEAQNINVATQAVDLRVEDSQRQHGYMMKGILSRDRLNISLDNLVTQEEVFKWPHLQDIADEICLPDVDLADEVHLLIGLDQPDILAPRESRLGEPGEPYATLSGLGWTLNGPVSEGLTTVSANFVQTDNILQQAVEKSWKLDDPVQLNNNSPSLIEKQVIDLWDKQAVKTDGHYTLPIPFKEHPPQLPSNYHMAKHRLDLLGKRLRKDTTLRKKYTEGIHDSLRKGYSEKVTNVDREDGYLWYLPHHPVLHPRKDKVRIVFDCSARCQGTSLNDRVHQGPDLTNQLLAVLLKFRQEPIALSADIEGMFCQVRVPPQERDVMRFLWWEDDDPDKPPQQYRMTSHLFGGVWSSSVATYALQRVAEDYRSEFSKEVIETVLRNFYVDDCLKSLSTEDAAIVLHTELRELLARGGFRLTKWLSNSKRVMKSIPADEWAKSLHQLNLDQDSMPYERMLGVLWDVERDCFTFDAKAVDKPATKRGMLSATSSVYDPLGFAGPFVLKAKALFQELCRLKVDWDDDIPEAIAVQWHRWLADLPLLSKMSIPRCLKPANTSAAPVTQLHHFSDASEIGYGAVSYLRRDSESRLVMSKARLAPIKATSIPHLELLAAVVATEMDLLIKRHLEIPIDETFFWTDSTIVLHYINNDDRRFQTFVANRVAKIRERSEPSQWRHVDSASNPADEVSRGMTAREILADERWTSGPSFLRLGEEDWPVQPTLGALPEVAEVKPTKQVYAADVKVDHASAHTVDRLLGRYSDWHRLKRAIAILLRLKALLRKKEGAHLSQPMTVKELRGAEVAILVHVQAALSKTSSIPKLKPFTEEETKLLRVGGRLTNAPISFEAKHQIILPSDHHVTRLIANHYHIRLGHAGPERVLAEIRQRFWVLKGRSTISRVLRSCMKCRKLKATPQSQQMADLPKSRVTPGEPPFNRVGVDYFGPFLIKRARSQIKRYGCLFTCLVTRAIHLEVSHSLETDSFINALQRFIARRGPPTEIRSDNGTNFVGGLRELRKAISEWNHQKISDHLLQDNVRWIFNPPAASHMGGVWERQIRTVRSILNTVLTQQAPDDEGLATLFCCVEAIVNGRPITKLSDDPSDPLPLTPNHLLLLRCGPTLPPGAFVKQDLYRRRWRQVQYLADIFWSRWLKEYLPALQQRGKWLLPTRNLQVGDLVLILHENTPRHSWPLGLITEVFPGADNLVRTVRVKTQAGLFNRPADKVCLLEANLV